MFFSPQCCWLAIFVYFFYNEQLLTRTIEILVFCFVCREKIHFSGEEKKDSESKTDYTIYNEERQEVDKERNDQISVIIFFW